jgi:hypothetical protein
MNGVMQGVYARLDMWFSTAPYGGSAGQDSDIFGCTTSGKAHGGAPINDFSVVIEPEKPADTTI